MIGIVGGGIAGLAAAYRLQRRGHDVHVFEASDDIGGLAATHETAGDPIEKFYHHLSHAEHTIVELASELGLGDAVEWRYKSDAFYVDGVVHPMNTIWEIAAYPPLSLYDKLRLGLLTLGVDTSNGIPTPSAFDDLAAYDRVPIKEFLLEQTTQRVYENFWEPLLDAKFGSRKEDVSAAWLLGRIKFRGERDLLRGEQLGYLEGSFSRLIDALIEAVGRDHITTGAEVTEIEFTDGAATGLVVDGQNERETAAIDGVVVAAMPSVLESLTGYECGIDFQGTVCAVVSLPERLTDAYWINLLEDAGFGVVIEHTNFVPPARYGGEHLVYLASYVQDFDERVWRLDDDALADYWLAELESLFPAFDPDAINWIRVARNPQTAPVYSCGYLDEVVPYDLSDAVAENVYYAGMASRAQYPERSLNGAIEAGFAAADQAASRAAD